jgi:excisionase family DNA binding protein
MERLACGRNTVYTMIASGQLPHVRIGKGNTGVRVPLWALNQWIAENTQQGYWRK